MRVQYINHFNYEKIFYTPFVEEVNGIPLLFLIHFGKDLVTGVENYRHILQQNPLDGYFTDEKQAREYMARINDFNLSPIEHAVLNEMHLTYKYRMEAMTKYTDRIDAKKEYDRRVFKLNSNSAN